MTGKFLTIAAATIVTLASPTRHASAQVGQAAPDSGWGRPFGGMSVSPISSTAVLHAKLVPAADSGAMLVYAVSLRGPVSWYDHPTSMRRAPADSVPEGVEAERWTVGPREYELRYDAVNETISVCGQTFDLRRSRLILVALGATPTDSSTVVQGELPVFRLGRPEPLAPRLMASVVALREFAGLKP